jgi:hypothetical protein
MCTFFTGFRKIKSVLCKHGFKQIVYDLKTGKKFFHVALLRKLNFIKNKRKFCTFLFEIKDLVFSLHLILKERIIKKIKTQI